MNKRTKIRVQLNVRKIKYKKEKNNIKRIFPFTYYQNFKKLQNLNYQRP